MFIRYLLVIYALLFGLVICGKSATISGTINIDESWDPKIYLSLINAFDDLTTASYDFLIAETVVDTSGKFSFKALNLPQTDRIYRLHICKKGDPVSTIIMGGKDENFIHFVANNMSQIKIMPDTSIALFSAVHVAGHPANGALKLLMQLKNSLLYPPDIPSAENRRLLHHQVVHKLKQFADTASQEIIQLMAIYYVMDYFGYAANRNFIDQVVDKMADSDSVNPYYLACKDEIAFNHYQIATANKKPVNWGWFVIIAITIVLSFGIYYIQKSRKNESRIDGLPEKLLSIQERKVFALLKQGKSNKEIAEALHIEVSTVKSHLNKIYSRLGVKSRKEIMT